MMAVAARAAAVLNHLGEKPIVAEVGVYEGAMSARLLAREDLKLVMVDSWGKHLDARWEGADMDTYILKRAYAKMMQTANDVTYMGGERRSLCREFSHLAAARFPDAHFDAVFIDADHRYEGVKADIRAWTHKVKPGGYLCGHDYSDTYPGVKQAVQELLGEVELDADSTWFKRCD